MNINLLKLVIGMQLELRTCVQKLGDMEKTLSDILAGAEQEQRHEIIHALHPPVKKKRYAYRATPAGRKQASEQQKAYWASPAGQARRAKGTKSGTQGRTNSERVTV